MRTVFQSLANIMMYFTEDVRSIWKSELVLETQRGKWRAVFPSFTDILYELDEQWKTLEQLASMLEELFFPYLFIYLVTIFFLSH